MQLSNAMFCVWNILVPQASLVVALIGSDARAISKRHANLNGVAISSEGLLRSSVDVEVQIEEDLTGFEFPIKLPPAMPPTDSDLFNALVLHDYNITCKHPVPTQSWRLNLPRAPAVHHALNLIGSQYPPAESACARLNLGVDRQFASLTQNQHDVVWAWTVTNQAYGKWIADWIVHMSSIGVNRVMLVSIDPDSKWTESLCKQGLPVIDFTQQGRHNISIREAKLKMPAYFLRNKVTNLQAELDIFWESTFVNVDYILKETKGADLVLAPESAHGSPLINIGFWLCKHDASENVALLFEQALKLEEWDQDAMNDLIRHTTQIKTYGNTQFLNAEGQRCRYSQVTCKSLSEIRIGLLADILIQGWIGVSTLNRFDKRFPAGVHIFSKAGSMKSSAGKMIVAQNAGLFAGAGCYYEQCNLGEQYVTWDGFLHEGEQATDAMELLLIVAYASNRSVIMPYIKSRNGAIGFAEQAYRLDHPSVRESNFLSNPRLPLGAMYPVKHVIVNGNGWAIVRTLAKSGQASTEYFKDADGASPGTVARLVSALLQLKDVSIAKTLILNVVLDAPGRYLPTIDKTSCGVASYNIAGRVHRCKTVIKDKITASDVC